MNICKSSYLCLLTFSMLTFIDIHAQKTSPSNKISMFIGDGLSFYIPDINDAYGVAFRDINGDQWPDVYLVCFRGINRLLLNRGLKKNFKDVTIESGLAGDLMSKGTLRLELGTAIADFDNDGDGDILITGWDATSGFFRNDGKLKFINISKKLNLPSHADINGCFVADINNDGLLDVFLTDEHFTNRMLLNRGNNIFKDITGQSGLEYNAVSQSAAFCDVDNDGDQDLYVCNWLDRDLFYCNTGNGCFKRIDLPIESCRKADSTNCATFGDVDNDGDYDLFVTNRHGRNFLYINKTQTADSNFVFVNVSEQANIRGYDISYSSVVADFNNDGWLDIFVSNIGQNYFYINKQHGKFEKILQDSYPEKNQKRGYSTGAACADYDHDGDLDLFVANKDTFSVFYENTTNNNSYIKLNVLGISSNRDAVGSRIEFYQPGKLDSVSGLLGVRQINIGSGYLSMNDPVVHFGLDTLSRVDVRIRFPGGQTVVKENLLAGESYLVYEYTAIKRIFILSGQYLKMLFSMPTFWYNALLLIVFCAYTIIFIKLGLKRYRWNPTTTTIYLTVLFLIISILVFILKKLPLLYIFLAIDSIAIPLISASIIYSERFIKLNRLREKDRAVLIGLANKMIGIHDDNQLFKTVVSGFRQNSEFDKCLVLAYDSDKQKFVNGNESEKINRLDKLFDKSRFSAFITLLGERSVLTISENPNLQAVFQLFDSEIMVPVKRGQSLYALLILISSKKVKIKAKVDIDLYISIANQMAIALENNSFIRNSNEMIKKLTEVETREKYLNELENINATLDTKNQQLQNLYEELKNTQTQLIHSEKMSSLGQLVAGISHELNNPISYIYSNIQQLQAFAAKITAFIENFIVFDRNTEINLKELQEMLPDMKNLINDTVQGSKSVKELVENLRRFSHLDQAESKLFDVHQGIESSLKILTPQLKNRIAVHKNYQLKKQVECNPGQINQVFLNLLSNAAFAISNKGNIWITTAAEQNKAIIEIRDDGSGIDPDIQSRVFDPFFTTKDIGQGTGLGLSIVYSIIKNHHGKIHFKSRLQKGTSFFVELPLVKDKSTDDQ